MNKELAANTTLSHYRIVSKIGAGGMGEVYLAQDTKLDRKVALKVLPADLAANHDRMRRFTQEAKPRRRSIIRTSPPSMKSARAAESTSSRWSLSMA